MAADTSVKVYKSTDAGAPSLSGAAGALIAVLDACLVNGYNLLTAQSVSVASGVATMTFAAAHGFVAGRVLLVAGATPTGLNGERRVLSSTTNSLTIDATGVSDGSATGTITVKIAPAGWVKPFSGTNLAVYKPTDVAARTQYIRVDDTGATDARVCGYEAMTDVNTGAAKIPLESQVSGGVYWPKANNTTGSRAWIVIASSKVIYVYVVPNTAYPTSGFLAWAGDSSPRRSADAYAWGVSGGAVAVSSASSNIGSMGYSGGYSSTTNDVGLFQARAYSGLGGANGAARTYAHAYNGGHTFGSSQALFAYPNAPDNSLILAPLVCVNLTYVRGYFPGLFVSPQAVISALGVDDKIAGADALAGRTLMPLLVGGGSNPPGVVFMDITGPWS